MNKQITIIIAVALFAIGAFIGKGFGEKNATSKIETMPLTPGNGIYLFDTPTLLSTKQPLKTAITPTVLEKVKFDKPIIVILRGNYTAKSASGDTYILKKDEYFKLISINDGTANVTIEALTDGGQNIQLNLPRSILSPVNEGEWARVKEPSIGEKWVIVKSDWVKKN